MPSCNMGFLDNVEDDEDGFLEGVDDEGDGFLDDVDDAEGGFLESEEPDNAHKRLPTPYAVSNQELVDEHWQDDWNDITDDVVKTNTVTKIMPCAECGYTFCVSQTVRSYNCRMCGAVNVDFEYKDERVGHGEMPEWD